MRFGTAHSLFLCASAPASAWAFADPGAAVAHRCRKKKHSAWERHGDLFEGGGGVHARWGDLIIARGSNGKAAGTKRI